MLHPFGWQNVDAAKLTEIRTKLAQFESMTWNEILVDSKRQNHSVAVWKLRKEAQERLGAIGLGDTEEVVSLRLSGRERVWGLRQGAVLLILSWGSGTRRLSRAPQAHVMERFAAEVTNMR